MPTMLYYPCPGGGIPEIKAFLNGVDLQHLINVRVLFAKMFGTCFAIGRCITYNS